MTTVFDGLVAIANRLPRTVRGIATAGGEDVSDWIYVDDLVALTNYADNVFIGGTLLLETGPCAGAVLAVRDSIQATGRVLGDQRWWAQTAAEVPAAGDIYAVTSGLYGPAQLLLSLREALRSWGDVEARETVGSGDGIETTFTTTTDGEVARVFIVNEDGDEETEYVHWEPVTGGVELAVPPADTTTVKALIRYPAEDAVILPPTRATLDDELGDIPAEFLGYYGAYATVRAALGSPGQDQDMAIKIMNYYAEQAEVERNRYQGRGLRGRERFMR